MRKSYRFLIAFLMAGLTSFTASAQSVTISGTVKNSTSKESVPAVSIVVKGSTEGTYTNSNGEFSLKVSKLPVVLVFTSAGGYDAQEVTVSSVSKPVEVELKVNNVMGNEVVVSASRLPQRILDAPVTVERMSSSTLRNIPAPNYYEAISNLKGVDMHTASLTFRTITTRGFVSSGNTRMNQLIDGMDNQAPGLNFSVGGVIGLTELDVDNVELLSGASSALYGSGGMNGTILLTSKNPFKYQGFSYNIKQGIMHVDEKQRTKAPYYDWSFRWAKAYHKVAIKLAAQLTKGNDWQADDYRNKQQIGILSKVVGGNRSNDPNFNGINVYGDETSANMNGFAFFVQESTRRALLAASGGLFDVVTFSNAYWNGQGNPAYPTDLQVAGWKTAIQGIVGAAGATAAGNMFPFYNGLKNNYFHNASVSRTGYEEKYLVDYNTINAKLTAGLHWKINDRTELSWNSYLGTGTTVYTGADRYSLRNLKMAQHKLEVVAKNWYARAYTTQENAGDSYNASAVGAYLNEAAFPSGGTTGWIPTFVGTFSETRRLNALSNLFPSDITISNGVRSTLDATRLQPGTTAFDIAIDKIKRTPIVNGGALFLDRSDLYAMEGQLNLSGLFGFSDKFDLLVGLSDKQWVMNSKGTIFADNVDSIGYTKVPKRGNITISEKGAYVQASKKFLNDRLTLTGSVRWDKQTNFDGKFTPRVSAVIKVAQDNNIRVSYQTAYRFPTNQNQYISLITGSGALIGCLPEFQNFYKLTPTSPGYRPGYTAASVLSYRSGTIADSSRLVEAAYKEVKPETVKSFEFGYKGIVGKKMLWDAYVYYSKYNDFIVNSAVVQSNTGSKWEVYSPFSSKNLSYVQNSTQEVKAYGWGIGLEYKVFKNYMLYGNVYSDMLKDVPADVVTFFNAPKYRYNIGLRNDNVCHNIGFNVIVKYQDNNYYEGTFVSGTLPYFTTVDAQLSFRPAKTKSVFRIGGTNLGNNYYRTGFGSPAVGGLYYVSYGYNIF